MGLGGVVSPGFDGAGTGFQEFQAESGRRRKKRKTEAEELKERAAALSKKTNRRQDVAGRIQDRKALGRTILTGSI